jgi:antitoxin ParD1/3/4
MAATGLWEGKVMAISDGNKWQILTPFPLCHRMDHRRIAAMQSMNISLPESLKAFVDSQIASGRYSSASEYMRELIREDEKRRAAERLESLLLAGLGSEARDMTPDDWRAIRAEAVARLKHRQKTGG